MGLYNIIMIDHKLGIHTIISSNKYDLSNCKLLLNDFQEITENKGTMMVEELTHNGEFYGHRYANETNGLLFDVIICKNVANKVNIKIHEN